MMTTEEIERMAGEPLERAALLRELGRTNHPGALQVAKRFLGDEQYATRIAALDCIGAVGQLESLPSVRAALSDAEALVRIAAIETLVELGSADQLTIDALQSVVSDERESVRAYAGWALGRLGAANARDTLRTRLREESSAVAKAGLLEGLYLLTKQESYLAMLQGLLEVTDPEARAFASNSLVGVASRINVKRLIERLTLAVSVETYPAIRDVLSDNLATLTEMDAEDDFDLE